MSHFGALVKQYHTSLSNLNPEGGTRMHRQQRCAQRLRISGVHGSIPCRSAFGPGVPRNDAARILSFQRYVQRTKYGFRRFNSANVPCLSKAHAATNENRRSVKSEKQGALSFFNTWARLRFDNRDGGPDSDQTAPGRL